MICFTQKGYYNVCRKLEKCSDYSKYLISDSGKVLTLMKGTLKKKDKHKTVIFNQNKYKICELVLNYFCGEKPFLFSKPHHKDGNIKNNRLSNLVWNSRDLKHEHGLIFTEEKWLPIKNTNKIYWISSDGRIGKIKKCYYNNDGYKRVPLVRDSDGKYKQWFLHRLVLTAFKGPPPDKSYHCCHGDGNKANNHIKNLRWDTPQNNQKDRHMNMKGETNPIAKLKDCEVIEIRRVYATQENIKISDLAEQFDVSGSTIREIIDGKRWLHLTGWLKECKEAYENRKYKTKRKNKQQYKITKELIISVRKDFLQDIPFRHISADYEIPIYIVKDIINNNIENINFIEYVDDIKKKKNGRIKYKVTDEEVKEMRAAYKNGESQGSLALRYGIHQTTVGKIVNYEKRKNVV